MWDSMMKRKSSISYVQNLNNTYSIKRQYYLFGFIPLGYKFIEFKDERKTRPKEYPTKKDVYDAIWKGMEYYSGELWKE